LIGVQFGAGNIGRGFMAHLFRESGLETVFVEAREELVRALNSRGWYPLRLLKKDGSSVDLKIDKVRAFLPSEKEKISQAISAAKIIATAVGAHNLPAIAPFLAAGFAQRCRESGEAINVLCCENLKDAPQVLQNLVLEHLEGEEERKFVAEKVGFVGTVIARMVPVVDARFGVDDPLFLVAEHYYRLPYDAKAVRGEMPRIVGLVPVKNFVAEMDRKLFIHNLGHAVLAYWGYLKGYRYIHEAIGDEEIASILDGAWQEVSKALLQKYPDLDPKEHTELVKDLRERFANPLLMDTVQRVARDPLRKLKPQDRIVGAAMLCMSQGIFPEFVALCLAAALLYDWPEDQEAQKLQELIVAKGVKAVLKEVCELDPESDFARRVLEEYQKLCVRKKEWRK